MAVVGDRIIAGRVARSAEIMDIRLFEASSELIDFGKAEGILSFAIDVNPVIEYDAGADYFVLRASYEVTISSTENASEETASESANDGADDSGETVARIRCNFGALYRLGLESDEPEIRQDELDAYARTAGMLCLHPYVREHVNYMTRNLGLPSLVLPIFKLPLIGAPDPTAVEPSRLDDLDQRT